MKDDKLFRAMGDIDEGYLDEAYTYGKHVKKFRPAGSLQRRY